MRAKIKNVLTGKIVSVHSDSSYGKEECWVDAKGKFYGQCHFGAPIGYELIPVDVAASTFGALGGRVKSPRKSEAAKERNAKRFGPKKVLQEKVRFFLKRFESQVGLGNGQWRVSNEGRTEEDENDAVHEFVLERYQADKLVEILNAKVEEGR